MASPANLLESAVADETPGALQTLRNALIVTRREVRDSLRDWRILAPILILTFLFPALAQFVAGRFTAFVTGYGAEIIGERTIPFLLMIVGFFPISISLVIALETFVGEKERRSLEPLFTTPLSNTELYIGKTLAAMIPPLVSSYCGMLVYLAGLVFGGVEWRPQPALVVQIFLLTAAQALVMVTGAVVVSSQTTSTRAANLLASFIVIPVALLVQGESAIMFLAPDAESPHGIGALWAIIIGMLVVVVLLLRLGNSVFNREEVLGRSIDQINPRATLHKIWRHVRAVDERGTPARNLQEWYRRGVTLSLRRLRPALFVTGLVFVAAFLAGVSLGQQPEWRLPVFQQASDSAGVVDLGASLDTFVASGPGWIVFHNGRILLVATLLSLFTFGVAALVLTPGVYFVLGFALSQVMVAGLRVDLVLAAVIVHGLVEVPVILLAAAAALRAGAIVTSPPHGWTVGHAWTVALSDLIRVGLGLVIPGLLIAALLETYLTPLVVRAVAGV